MTTDIDITETLDEERLAALADAHDMCLRICSQCLRNGYIMQHISPAIYQQVAEMISITERKQQLTADQWEILERAHADVLEMMEVYG